MKKIKIKIHGHPIHDQFGYSYFILSILKKYYDVELSEQPDYLFYNESMTDHYMYDCIKIFYTGENSSPNFNQCDYAISYDYCDFEDRHYRMPMYLVYTFYTQDELKIAGENYLTKKINFTEEDLHKKTSFCSFVYSNYRSDTQRRNIFEKLSTYKKVNSAGAYLNNTGGKKIKNKLEYELNHKFSIAFENSTRSGYTTEKLTSALVAKTIPIYWGNPSIGKEFNTKRFINCHDYASFDDVLEKVKELDTNDDLYIKMINEPIQNPNYDFDAVRNGYELFLKNIFDQPLAQAQRRTINPVLASTLKEREKIIAFYTNVHSLLLKIGSTLYRPFKRIQFLEKLKHEYFRKK